MICRGRLRVVSGYGRISHLTYWETDCCAFNGLLRPISVIAADYIQSLVNRKLLARGSHASWNVQARVPQHKRSSRLIIQPLNHSIWVLAFFLIRCKVIISCYIVSYCHWQNTNASLQTTAAANSTSMVECTHKRHSTCIINTVTDENYDKQSKVQSEGEQI